MAREPFVCIKAVRIALLQAGASGLDVARLVGELGLDASQLADPYARVPHGVVARLWRVLPERAGDAAFGLRAAERAHAFTFDAIDGAFRHAATLRDVLDLLTRYQRLLHEGATIDRTVEGNLMRMHLSFACVEPAPPQLIEMVLAMWVLRSRALVGEEQRIVEVTLPHPGPADLREHRRLFGVTPRFLADGAAIRFPVAALDAPVRGADRTLGVVLDRHVREVSDRLPRVDDPVAAVSGRLREALADGVPDVGRVARSLGRSRRGLQRELHGAGTTFQRLADQARRERALDLVTGSDLALTEVAFLAGFAELSAFTRAFRRWAGCSPSQYRTRRATVA